ncbi:hypothetical protein KM043_012831 [Ampulex compressa]|nr:hypothetical protein KM043_012831 [Ampulex compressa]
MPKRQLAEGASRTSTLVSPCVPSLVPCLPKFDNSALVAAPWLFQNVQNRSAMLTSVGTGFLTPKTPWGGGSFRILRDGVGFAGARNERFGTCHVTPSPRAVDRIQPVAIATRRLSGMRP